MARTLAGKMGGVGARQRFRGRIAGAGSTSGVRVVVGWWHESPFGAFADAMVERADGRRILLAPTDEVAATRVGDLRVRRGAGRAVRGGGAFPPDAGTFRVARHRRGCTGEGSGAGWSVTVAVAAPDPGVRRPDAVGPPAADGARARWPRALPGPRRSTPWLGWCCVGCAPAGSLASGRREFYGATDVCAVTRARGRFDGIPLGDLRPVDPPCRFGFSSTPRAPSVTHVVTTIVDTA